MHEEIDETIGHFYHKTSYKAIAQCAKIGTIDFNFLFACVNSNAKISLSQIFHHSILGFPKLHFFRILCLCE